MPFICLLYDLLGIPRVFFTVHRFVMTHIRDIPTNSHHVFKNIGMEIRHSKIISRLCPSGGGIPLGVGARGPDTVVPAASGASETWADWHKSGGVLELVSAY